MDSATNTKTTYVHYKGLGPMYTDLVATRLDVSAGPPFLVGPFVKSGKLIAIANLSTGRAKFMPELVSVSEQGFADFSCSTWSAYLAPAKTPAAIINRWHAAFAFAGKAPEVIQQAEAGGGELVISPPEVLAKQIAVDYARQRKIIADNGIRLGE